MLDFRTSKFVLRISRDSYQLLKRHLQEKQNNQIWNIVQEHLYIDIFDGMPRSKQQIDAMVGSLAGEAKREANKAKVGDEECCTFVIEQFFLVFQGDTLV